MRLVSSMDKLADHCRQERKDPLRDYKSITTHFFFVKEVFLQRNNNNKTPQKHNKTKETNFLQTNQTVLKSSVCKPNQREVFYCSLVLFFTNAKLRSRKKLVLNFFPAKIQRIFQKVLQNNVNYLKWFFRTLRTHQLKHCF